MPYNDPWFDPSSPGATWGRGAASVMQGMYGNAMLQKQMDEQRRQFDIEQALAQQKQDWTQTNTPAYQFGQMADVTREKLGSDVDPSTIQENYFGNFRPHVPPTVLQQAMEIHKAGATKTLAEAVDKVLKTGPESPNMIRATYGSGGQPNPYTVKYEDARRREAAGQFGVPGSPESLKRMEDFVQGTSFPDKNVLQPYQKQLTVHAHRVVIDEIERLMAEAKAIASRPELINKERDLAPEEEGRQGFLGIFGKKREAWPSFYAQRHRLVVQQANQLRTALKFIEDLLDDTKGGYTMDERLQRWIQEVIRDVKGVYDENTGLFNAMGELSPIRTPVGPTGPAAMPPPASGPNPTGQVR